ncbi:MAG: outer membrane protein assembly factor BamD [Alphaproteobacteria bacterium]|nr:MAG: outer membrane protein assembly factor BamD [Alphaproteobacteria bacterium]
MRVRGAGIRVWAVKRTSGQILQRLFLLVLCAALLSGCGSRGETPLAASSDPPEVLFKQGDLLLGKGKFRDAAEKFEEVDRDHPYSPYARRAIVMAAYAHYQAGHHTEAIQAAQRYVTLHPGTKEAALAYHIIASAEYDRITDPSRDQAQTKKALAALETLVRRYPDSRYAAKARNRIKIAKDILAAAEMDVGRYYLKRHNYLAAINRFRVVVTDYQTTAHVEEALMRIAEAYMALGIKGEAQTAAAVLGHNFPDSQWYRHAYTLLQSDGLEPRENTGSWISRVWRKTKPS